MNKKKELVLAVLGIMGVLVLTIAVTYAFFTYTKEGTTENTITTGKITFLYTETSFGRGIKLENAMPMSDTDGKKQVGDRNVFDFKITSDTISNVAIPYDVTVVKQSESDLEESDVKIYIAEVNANIEEYGKIGKFNDDSKFPKYNGSNVERVIYKGKVPSGKEKYIQNLRLKMWISDDAEFSPLKDNDGNYIIENGEYKYPNNNKTFKVKVNVYATGGLITDTEVANESASSIEGISIGGTPLVESTTEHRLYEKTLPEGTIETEIEVVTQNEYQKVKVEKTEDDYETTLSMNTESRIEKMTATKKLTLPLTAGENYFKITVVSEDGTVNPNTYKLHITVEKIYMLYEMKQGDYVAYEGDPTNGCLKDQTSDTTYDNGDIESKNSCKGWNARQTLTTGSSFGYCESSGSIFKVYGWRIAYIEGENAYLISAGSPECNSTTFTTAGNQDYIDFANNQAKKYCNSIYVDNCSSDSDVHAINNIDYNKITKQLNLGTNSGYLSYPEIEDATKCLGVSTDGSSNSILQRCGLKNDLIANGGNYWFAAKISESSTNGIMHRNQTSKVEIVARNTSNSIGLRPVIKISSSVYVSGGKGTMAEPYEIAK